MLRRLLACLVVLAIAVPMAAMGARARLVVAECECPPGKSQCGDRMKACDCGLACVARVAVAEPAISTAAAPAVSPAPAPAADMPMTRGMPPSGAPMDAPFRPPRSTILL